MVVGIQLYTCLIIPLIKTSEYKMLFLRVWEIFHTDKTSKALKKLIKYWRIYEVLCYISKTHPNPFIILDMDIKLPHIFFIFSPQKYPRATLLNLDRTAMDPFVNHVILRLKNKMFQDLCLTNVPAYLVGT